MLNDLTTGNPPKVIWRFSMPLLLSMAFQQMYNIVDSIIVGQLIDSNALASIGAAYPITLLFIAIATGLSMGASVIIGQHFGAKQMTVTKSAVNTITLSMAVLGIIVGIAGIVLAGPLMSLLKTPDILFGDSATFLAIYSAGVPALFAFNTANAIFTGFGDSKRPLYFLIFSSVLNVILVLVAVGPLKMGVAGAAWATTVAQYTAATMAGFVLLKQIRAIKTDERPKLFDTGLLGEICRLSLPAILQQSCIALGHTFIQSLVNTFSEAFISGYQVASRISNFAYMCLNTIGTALSSFVAQNFGAHKTDRIRPGFRASLIICLSLAAVFIACMQIFAPQLVGLFVNAEENPGVIEAGSNFLRTVSPDYMFICFIITIGGFLRGIGRVKDFLIITILDLGIRVTMSFVLTRVLDSYMGIFWAWYFGSIPDMIIGLFLFRRAFRGRGVLAPRG